MLTKNILLISKPLCQVETEADLNFRINSFGYLPIRTCLLDKTAEQNCQEEKTRKGIS